MLLLLLIRGRIKYEKWDLCRLFLKRGRSG